LTNDPKFRESLQIVLRDAIALMKEIDQEKVFHYPVTDEKAPEYSSIIEEPMCLSIMEEKVTGSLYRNIEEFTSDVSY
jgi:bromodomain-containing protein 7/9